MNNEPLPEAMKTLLAFVLLYAVPLVIVCHERMEIPHLTPEALGSLLVLAAVALWLDFAAILPALAALAGTAAALTPDTSLQALGSFACLVLGVASVALFIHREVV